MKLLHRADRGISDAIISEPEDHTVMDTRGGVRSIQAANVSMPEGEMPEYWTPMYLERLARTYWKFLSRVSLGLIRVEYTESERRVVLLRRPFVLLRFHAPDYETAEDRGIVFRLTDNDFRCCLGRGAQRRHPARPVESGSLGGQIGERAQVVGQVGVPALDDVPVRGGQLGLQGDDPRRCIGVIAAVHEREHRGDVAGIRGQDRGVLLVAVVGLVGQPHPRLAQVHQIAGGVLGIGVDVIADTATDAGALQPADHRGQRLGAVGGVNACQLVQQRLHTAFGHCLLVHEAGVQVADALFVGAFRGAHGSGFGDQIADVLLGAVIERAERTVGGAVGRHLVLGQPAAVDVAEQIVLGAGIRVDVAQVDTGAGGFYRHSNILPDAAATLSSLRSTGLYGYV